MHLRSQQALVTEPDDVPTSTGAGAVAGAGVRACTYFLLRGRGEIEIDGSLPGKIVWSQAPELQIPSELFRRNQWEVCWVQVESSPSLRNDCTLMRQDM